MKIALLFLSLLLCARLNAGIRISPSQFDRKTTRESTHLDGRWLFSTARTVSVEVPQNPDDHLVSQLPLLDKSSFTTNHWAGLLPASKDQKKYFFYWLFEPDTSDSSKSDADIPLLIWLNGGPACSSMDGLFIENGPFRFEVDPETKEYKLVPDDHSWHKLPAYTLYIDQPVGTGLSFTTNKKYPRNDQELCTDFYYFLQQFLKLHSDKFVDDKGVMNRDLFFSGESYAGHYNAIYTNHILKQNDKLGHEDIRIRMKGAAIGNGWVDPYYQYAGADAAYGHGLIGTSEVAALKEKEITCQRFLDKGHYRENVCFDLIDDIVDASFGKGSKYHVSSYDIRRIEGSGSRDFPPGHKIVESYLGKWPLHGAAGTLPDDIMDKALHALHAEESVRAGQRYQECTDPPYNALSSLDGKGVVPDMVQILEHSDNVKLLFFNGIQDMVCNHAGNERSLEKLPWKHNYEWNTAPRYSWMTEADGPSKVSGYMREFNNLLFLKIMNAGHMVPLDVPAVAFEMMQTFLYGLPFKTNLQNLEREKNSDCPVCPSCPNIVEGSGIKGSPTGWFVVIGTVVAGFLLYALICRKNSSVSERVNIPTELELQESRYTDKPESDDEDEEDRSKLRVV